MDGLATAAYGQALDSVHYGYLTHSEGIKLTAQIFDKDVAKLSCCAG